MFHTPGIRPRAPTNAPQNSNGADWRSSRLTIRPTAVNPRPKAERNRALAFPFPPAKLVQPN